MLKTYAQWVLPIIMAVLTPFTPYLDISIAQYFYHLGSSYSSHFITNEYNQLIYHYGVVPAEIVSVLSFIALVMSYLSKKWKKWRSPALLLVLTMAIGSGLITHVILKDHWGRPRPRQVIEFGGSQSFHPYYIPDFFNTNPSKSFPCGHCTMGFFFFALALAGKRLGSKSLCYIGYSLAFILGILLSITRMSQGGHFLSDTLWGGLIMWYTALICDWMIYSKYNKNEKEQL